MRVVVSNHRKIQEFLAARKNYLQAVENKQSSITDEIWMVNAYGEMVKGTSVGRTFNRLLKAGVWKHPVHSIAFVKTIVEAQVISDQE